MAIVTASATRGIGTGMKRAQERRLSWAFVLSLAVHSLAVVVLVGMLQTRDQSPAARIGVALPIDVALVAQRPILFAAPPETPQQASESPPVDLMAEDRAKDPESSAVENPAPPPSQRTPPSPAPLAGAVVPYEASTEPLPSGPPPPGDVAGAQISDIERIGRVQALRMSSRYPQPVSKRPQLLDTLILPYPARAAFGYRNARIIALLLIDANGHTVDTTLYPDDPLFSPTVLAALRGARFAPGEIDTRPVPYWAMIEFVFTMRGSVRPSDHQAR